MLWYYRIKRCIGQQFIYDKWIGNFLVHYNFYEKTIEIKQVTEEHFNILYTIQLKWFMKIDRKWKRLISEAFPVML